MMITVVAVFLKGSAEPFPEMLSGIVGEGSIHAGDQAGEGGVIIVSFDTDNEDLVRKSFEAHLHNNELIAFTMQKIDDHGFFFWKTKRIFSKLESE